MLEEQLANLRGFLQTPDSSPQASPPPVNAWVTVWGVFY